MTNSGARDCRLGQIWIYFKRMGHNRGLLNIERLHLENTDDTAVKPNWEERAQPQVTLCFQHSLRKQCSGTVTVKEKMTESAGRDRMRGRGEGAVSPQGVLEACPAP